jgi:hypothetical protein
VRQLEHEKTELLLAKAEGNGSAATKSSRLSGVSDGGYSSSAPGSGSRPSSSLSAHSTSFAADVDTSILETQPQTQPSQPEVTPSGGRRSTDVLRKAQEKRIDSLRKEKDREIRDLKCKISTLISELTTLQESTLELEQTNAELAEQLAASPTSGLQSGGYKVLHLKENPVAWAMKANIVAAAAAAAGSKAGAGCVADVVAMEEALEKMRNERDAAIKKGDRLKQVFKEYTDAYKGIVYRLTGYHIDQFAGEGENKKFRVQSMYAERQDDYLVFEESTAGDLAVLGNDFAVEHQKTIEFYLGGKSMFNSFPGLMGQMTISLLENTTRC